MFREHSNQCPGVFAGAWFCVAWGSVRPGPQPNDPWPFVSVSGAFLREGDDDLSVLGARVQDEYLTPPEVACSCQLSPCPGAAPLVVQRDRYSGLLSEGGCVREDLIAVLPLAARVPYPVESFSVVRSAAYRGPEEGPGVLVAPEKNYCLVLAPHGPYFCAY